ncbi:hypothetical protein EV426DRAFT_594682 [Tirmania nivea]|nr:hypothetical protein EV426DRAFT_594682 [Tirmania nivea]
MSPKRKTQPAADPTEADDDRTIRQFADRAGFYNEGIPETLYSLWRRDVSQLIKETGVYGPQKSGTDTWSTFCWHAAGLPTMAPSGQLKYCSDKRVLQSVNQLCQDIAKKVRTGNTSRDQAVQQAHAAHAAQYPDDSSPPALTSQPPALPNHPPTHTSQPSTSNRPISLPGRDTKKRVLDASSSQPALKKIKTVEDKGKRAVDAKRQGSASQRGKEAGPVTRKKVPAAKKNVKEVTVDDQEEVQAPTPVTRKKVSAAKKTVKEVQAPTLVTKWRVAPSKKHVKEVEILEEEEEEEEVVEEAPVIRRKVRNTRSLDVVRGKRRPPNQLKPRPQG